MNWQKWLKKWWVLPRPAGVPLERLEPGLYHFQRERDGGYLRFHLRVQPGGEAVLIAGAAEAVRLPAPAALICQQLLSGAAPEELQQALKLPQADKAVAHVSGMLNDLARPDRRYPIFNLIDPAVEEPAALEAPFQANLVLGEPDAVREILNALWEGGIPHVRFVPAEIDIDGLALAVERAEDIGMIAGLRLPASGSLQDEQLDRVAKLGLDYVVLPWGVTEELHRRLYGSEDYARLQPTIEKVHQWEMTAVLEAPLVEETIDDLEEQVEQLNGWQVRNVEVFAVAAEQKSEDSSGEATPLGAEELRQAAAFVEDLADQRPLQMIWLPPVEAGGDAEDVCRRGPRAGGDVSIRVEATGEVIPPRGPRRVAGNLRRQAFREIRENDVWAAYRKRVESPTHCDECPGLAICAADCPARASGWATPETRANSK